MTCNIDSSESCVLITSPATVKSKTGCVCRNQPGGTKSTQPPNACRQSMFRSPSYLSSSYLTWSPSAAVPIEFVGPLPSISRGRLGPVNPLCHHHWYEVYVLTQFAYHLRLCQPLRWVPAVCSEVMCCAVYHCVSWPIPVQAYVALLSDLRLDSLRELPCHRETHPFVDRRGCSSCCCWSFALYEVYARGVQHDHALSQSAWGLVCIASSPPKHSNWVYSNAP
eukprot:COSAG02_NODE_900_length_16073_cov_87.296607_4_plen_223_part_00